MHRHKWPQTFGALAATVSNSSSSLWLDSHKETGTKVCTGEPPPFLYWIHFPTSERKKRHLNINKTAENRGRKFSIRGKKIYTRIFFISAVETLMQRTPTFPLHLKMVCHWTAKLWEVLVSSWHSYFQKFFISIYAVLTQTYKIPNEAKQKEVENKWKLNRIVGRENGRHTYTHRHTPFTLKGCHFAFSSCRARCSGNRGGTVWCCSNGLTFSGRVWRFLSNVCGRFKRRRLN